MSQVKQTPKRLQEHFRIAAKTEMLRRNIGVKDLAAQCGCSRQAVSLALNHGLCGNVRRAIAHKLNLQLA
jgi:hypothetical protein